MDNVYIFDGKFITASNDFIIELKKLLDTHNVEFSGRILHSVIEFTNYEEL